jgi:hypothetical protein
MQSESPSIQSAVLHQKGAWFSMSIIWRAAAVLVLAANCWAQAPSATLGGVATDPSGAVMADVAIKVVQAGTDLQRSLKTDAEGRFQFPFLPPGTYTVLARKDGFAPVDYSSLVLNVSDVVNLRVEMKLGTLTDAVTVVAESQTVNLSGSVATVIDRQTIANMPLSGRSLQSLFDLTPGVLRSAGIDGQFVVNGQRSDANYYQVDGVSANVNVNALPTGLGGLGQQPTLSVLNTTNTLASLDALQEFKIQTSSYAPEFGRSAGGQVSLVTRSGTNQFTGSLYEYFRNDKLDANDWFANRGGVARPPQRQNNFGGVFGGPLLKNRTFFFASHEVLLLRQPQTAFTTVPSLWVRKAAIPSIQAILNAYPLPTGPDRVDAQGVPTGGAEYTTTYADPTTMHTFGLRLDQNLGRFGNLFGRVALAPSKQAARSLGLANVRNTERRTDVVTIGHTWATAHVANDLRINYTRATGLGETIQDTFGGAVPVPDNILFPSFATSKTASMTFQINFQAEIAALTAGRNVDNSTRQFNLVEGFSILLGSHTFKMGVDYRRLNLDFAVNPSISPNFPTIANLIAGVVPSYSVTARQPGIKPVLHNTSLFVQDTWRATQRMTLTYGLRWELNPAPGDRGGKTLVTLKNTESLSLVDIDTSGRPFYPMRWHNFAPRLGVAYQVSRRKGWETTVRGGGGLYYDLGTTAALQGYEGYPYRITVNYPNVQFPLASASQVVFPSFRLTPPYTTTLAFAPDFVSPRTYQWNLTVEQALGDRQTISFAYVGAAGRKLTRTEAYRAPNPRFTDTVNVTRNEASSDYNSLQI